MASTFQQQIYDFMMESQYFPDYAMVDHQQRQLTQLLHHARAQCPFYQDRLQAVFRPDDSIDFSKWHEIPIITRKDISDHGEEMRANNLPPGHAPAIEVTGSGTTGAPVKTYHTRLASMASQAAMHRAHRWFNFDFSKNMFCWFSTDENGAKWPEGHVVKGWGPSWLQGGEKGNFCVLHQAEPDDHAFDFMQRQHPSYLAGRPTSLFALAQYAEMKGLRPQMKGLVAFGSMVTETIRERCRSVFGSEILSIYASKETYDIAHQCPECSNHHVNSEIILVEVVDDNGNPCPFGQRGRAVVTPFFNTAQPLIRYDLGDQITMADGCVCDRTLPVISELNGRTVHMVRLPDGRKVAPRMPILWRENIGAADWQVAQTGPTRIELRYVKQHEAPAHEFAALTQIIRDHTAQEFEVSFVPLDKLPRTASGKVLEVVCELPPEEQK